MTVRTRRRDGGPHPVEWEQLSGTRRVPWDQWIGTGCACDTVSPCLLHFGDVLDWRGRAQAWDRAGVTPPSRR